MSGDLEKRGWGTGATGCRVASDASGQRCLQVLAGGMQPALVDHDLNGSRVAREALKLSAAIFLLMHRHSACTIGILSVNQTAQCDLLRDLSLHSPSKPCTMMMQLIITPSHSAVLH